MPFPISRSRTFRVATVGPPGPFVGPTLAAIEAWLAARGAGRMQRRDDEIAFRAGFLPLLTDWRKSTSKRLAVGWNPLMTVGSGRVQVAPGEGGLEVTYSLRFTQLIVVASVLFLVFFGATPESAQVSRWVSAAWFGLVPLGYLVASVGIGMALETVAKEAVDS